MEPDTANSPTIQARIARGATSNFIGRGIALLTGFALTPYVLHSLGAADYGLWLLVGAVVAYGGLLDLGIATAVTKFTAQYAARGDVNSLRRLIGTSLHLYSLLGLVVIALSAVSAPVLPGAFNLDPEARTRAAWLTFIMGSTVGLAIPCATTSAVLRGLQRYDFVNLVGVVGVLCFAVATVGVLSLGGGVVAMAAAHLPIILSLQALSLWLIRCVAPDVTFDWRSADRRLARTIISFSWSLFVVDVATRLQSKTDEIVIGALMPISYVAPYAIARRLSQLAHTLCEQFIKVLLPVASELQAANEPDRLRALYVHSTRITLALYLPIGCSVTLLSRSILSAWVGPEFAEHGDLVAILAIAGLISTGHWPAGVILQGIARHRWLALSAICAGVANVAISVALIPHLGLAGVALGTLLPTAAECLGFVLPFTMRAVGVGPGAVIREIVLPTFGPAVPTIGVLLAVQRIAEPTGWPELLLAVAAACAVYASVYLACGASRSERLAIRRYASGVLVTAQAYLRPVLNAGPGGR